MLDKLLSTEAYGCGRQFYVPLVLFRDPLTICLAGVAKSVFIAAYQVARGASWCVMRWLRLRRRGLVRGVRDGVHLCIQEEHDEHDEMGEWRHRTEGAYVLAMSVRYAAFMTRRGPV